MLFEQTWAHAVAGGCASVACLISVLHILQHLRYYSEPLFQRYIVRLIFLVPIYSMCSLASLLAPSASTYVSACRDVYEAWVIYNFMALCLAYVGGAGAVEVKMAGRTLEPSWLHWTCCLPPLAIDGHFVRGTKRGALQFVIVKPLLAIATVALAASGRYHEGSWAADDGYPYLAVVYNVTYSVALYALLLFYLGTHEILAPFHPLLKFVLIKAVIFLTYWQSFFVGLAVAAGALDGAREATNVQNFLVCIEMLPAAACMLFAFPWSEYRVAGGGLRGGNVTHAISIRDIVSDTVHQFAPAYHEYVLYSGDADRDDQRGASPPAPGGLDGRGRGGATAGGGGATAGGGGDPYPDHGHGHGHDDPETGRASTGHGPKGAPPPVRSIRTRTFVAIGHETSSHKGGNEALIRQLELGGTSSWMKGSAAPGAGADDLGDAHAYPAPPHAELSDGYAPASHLGAIGGGGEAPPDAAARGRGGSILSNVGGLVARLRGGGRGGDALPASPAAAGPRREDAQNGRTHPGPLEPHAHDGPRDAYAPGGEGLAPPHDAPSMGGAPYGAAALPGASPSPRALTPTAGEATPNADPYAVLGAAPGPPNADPYAVLGSAPGPPSADPHAPLGAAPAQPLSPAAEAASVTAPGGAEANDFLDEDVYASGPGGAGGGGPEPEPEPPRPATDPWAGLATATHLEGGAGAPGGAGSPTGERGAGHEPFLARASRDEDGRVHLAGARPSQGEAAEAAHAAALEAAAVASPRASWQDVDF